MANSGFVYLWFDKKHRRYYVGAHWGAPSDRYICSSDWMLRAYRRRPHDFKRRIVAVVTTTRADLFAEEARWLMMIKPSEIKARYYNLKNSADNLWHANPDEILTVGGKISKALKGRRPAHGHNPQVRAAISLGRKAAYDRAREETGSAMSAETKAKISESRSGIPHTAAHKKRMKATMRKVRAENPRWDRTHHRVCACCGEKFKGRETQRHCSATCRTNHWYRATHGLPVG